MNPTADARKYPWQDPDLIRSNPVFVADRLLDALAPWFHQDRLLGTSAGPARFSRCLEELARRDGRLPDAVVERFQRSSWVPSDFRFASPAERPGVIGLAVDPRTEDAFVLPFRPARLEFENGWDVARTLPFSEEDVQDLLVALVDAGVPDARGVLERFSYRFLNPLGQRIRGSSMTVGAVLAVLDELGGRAADLLRAAVVLVEPGADGALEEVEKIPAKLHAAFRECDRLSLVVVREGSSVRKEFDRERLGRVLEVRTVSDLARELASAGLLAPLIRAGTAPLGRSELVRIQNRLQSMIDNEHRYAEAADLAERVRGCKKKAPIDPGALTEIGRSSAAACRHHGRFKHAVELSEEIYDEVRSLGAGVSDDEEADAAAEYAAALFDSHQFQAIPHLLEPWATVAVDHPRRFRVLTRIKVWNTLARAQVILGPAGWEDLLGRSLELTRELNDPVNTQRTTSYLVHGLLRHGRAAEAVAVLAGAGATRDPLPPANPWVGFAVANAGRVEAVAWEHPGLDQACPEADSPKHAFGFYFQATGRQHTRAVGGELGRTDRLTRAAAFFRAEAGRAERNICVLFAASLDLAAAGLAPDATRWTDSVNKIREFLAYPDAVPLLDYYADSVNVLPTHPDPAAAEQLLCRVPYF